MTHDVRKRKDYNLVSFTLDGDKMAQRLRSLGITLQFIFNTTEVGLNQCKPNYRKTELI